MIIFETNLTSAHDTVNDNDFKAFKNTPRKGD